MEAAKLSLSFLVTVQGGRSTKIGSSHAHSYRNARLHVLSLMLIPNITVSKQIPVTLFLFLLMQKRWLFMFTEGKSTATIIFAACFSADVFCTSDTTSRHRNSLAVLYFPLPSNLFKEFVFMLRRHLVMLEGFDGTPCHAIFERVGSPADSRVNSPQI